MRCRTADSGMADPDCQNGFWALAHPLFVPCSLPATHSVYLLRTLLHSDCLLQNTTRPPSLPPFDRFVADRRREEARKFANFLGGAPGKGGAASDDIRRWHWQFVKSQKEPTHAFNERALPNLLRVVLDANTHSLVVREHPYYSLPSCHAPPRVGGGSSRNSRDKFSKMNH